MALLLSLSILMGGALLTGALIQRTRRWQREAAARLDPGEAVRLSAAGLPARLTVARSLTGGPVDGAVHPTRADLALGERTFVLATHHGRMVQIDAAHPGSAVTTGPRRLVIEGEHPSGFTRVRVELLVDAPEAWVEGVTALVQPRP